MWFRRLILGSLHLALLSTLCLAHAAPPSSPPKVVDIHFDAEATGTPFPHFWEQMFGSGRALLSLRYDYRLDLTKVHKATGFRYVRFHGILDDDVGLVQRNQQGKITYNFTYVDEIYDGLLARGVKPFVELSFMPTILTSNPKAKGVFSYHPNIAPPRSYAEWDDMIKAFAGHLIKRYGIAEVSTWYFEVWNEPNGEIFWQPPKGVSQQAAYFKLYANTVRALESVSPRLRVGGPATAQAAWVTPFLKYVHAHHLPIDFVSTHTYGDDTAENIFHRKEHISRKNMVCDAVDKVHREIEASPYPKLPLIYSEYNASYMSLPNVEDSVFMGPWLANTIRECAGKVQIMGYWAFSDVFEEEGVPKTPFYGGYGLIAPYRIPKPAFNAFKILHHLGSTRLKVNSDSALATRHANGSIVLALWNYAPPVGDARTWTQGLPKGGHKLFEIKVDSFPVDGKATIWRLDRKHGDVLTTYDKMGRPAFPDRKQIRELRSAAKLLPPQHVTVHNGKLSVDIPPQGLVVIELQ